MKILLDFDYQYVREQYYSSWFFTFSLFSGIKNLLGEQFSDNTIEYRTIISESTYYQSEPEQLKEINPVVITYDELRAVFNDQFITSEKITEASYNGDLKQNQLIKLEALYKEKLGDFEPDIILSFELHDKTFDYIFPNALQISFVGGLFKRGLGPTTFLFDPSGFIKYSSLNKFNEEINNFPISEEQECIINDFKNRISSLIKNANPTKALIQEYKKDFDYLVLLPLQFNGHYGFDTESVFKTQYDYLDYVMKNIPSNIGVIVTEHDHARFLEEGMTEKGGFLSWFENKYKNLIYIKELKRPGHFSSSLFLLSDVDAIINVSSSVALTGVLFDKKIISLGKSANDCYKDAQGLENISEILSSPMRNKNSLIYWFLTHYCFFEKQWNNEFMFDYLKRALAKFRTEGIRFSYFEQLNDLKEICDYTIDFLNNSILAFTNQDKPIEEKPITPVMRIFSIKKDGSRLIIRLLGLKISFRFNDR